MFESPTRERIRWQPSQSRSSARAQAAAGGHEIGQIAIGRRDKRTGPAHDVIAGKDRILPMKTKMIADMSGRMQCGQFPVLAGDDRAVLNDGNPVGRPLHHLPVPLLAAFQ